LAVGEIFPTSFGSGPGFSDSGLFTESGCFFSGPSLFRFFWAVREVQRLGMGRIFIRPDPTEQYFVAEIVFFTGRFFPAGNHVFRARNDLNERGLSGLKRKERKSLDEF
jgi:hypothetical protein